jgi:hypothetical protein
MSEKMAVVVKKGKACFDYVNIVEVAPGTPYMGREAKILVDAGLAEWAEGEQPVNVAEQKPVITEQVLQENEQKDSKPEKKAPRRRGNKGK